MNKYQPILQSSPDLLKVKVSSRSKSNLAQELNTFWNPYGSRLKSDTYDSEIYEIKKEYDKLSSDPLYPNKHFKKLRKRGIIISAVLFLVMIFMNVILPKGLEGLGEVLSKLFFYIVIFAFAPAVLYYLKIRRSENDLIKITIAKQNNWLYAPHKSSKHWQKLSIRYPEIFQVGDEDQTLQDEFYGKFHGHKSDVEFWTGYFEYSNVYYSDGKKRKTRYSKTTIAVRVSKQIKARFYLKPEESITSFLNNFRKKEISIESHDFNKSFAVFYNGKKREKELDIVKVLSPAVQVKLLDMKEKEGNYSVFFHGDAVIFVFNGGLIKKKNTNFIRKVEIDPKDQNYIKDRLESILEISNEIVKYLD